jgi:hypothetical protein
MIEARYDLWIYAEDDEELDRVAREIRVWARAVSVGAELFEVSREAVA